ncbi:MAG: ferredoxin--NADP reductase [Haliea sp.]|nr:MAG: ferredoxin--NADP reductase [Haliea sp.]
MSAFNEERVLSVHHWTDRLFTFTTTRDASLRFSNGHFTMIGLRVNDKPLIRAYLTSRLQHIQVGDSIIVGRKPTGTLLIDYLLPGKRLYLLSTGTGLAPFMSIIRDPATYENFEQVILVHGVRQADELAYHDLVLDHLPQHEFLGEMVSKQLLYYPTVTRESYRNMGRVTDLIETNKLFTDLQLPAFDAAHDRVMLCGSPHMLKDLKHILETRGFKEGNTTRPGDFVVERAFAEQ